MGRLEALEDQIQEELELQGTEAGLKSGKAMENELEELDAALSKIQAELEVNRKKLLRREQLEKAAEETERLSGDCQKQAGDKMLLLARMDAERAGFLGSMEEKKAVLGALTREENRRREEVAREKKRAVSEQTAEAERAYLECMQKDAGLREAITALEGQTDPMVTESEATPQRHWDRRRGKERKPGKKGPGSMRNMRTTAGSMTPF